MRPLISRVRPYFLLLLAFAGSAQAHNRGASYSDWHIDGAQATVEARVPQLELTRLQLHPEQPDYAPRVAALLVDALQLWSSMGPCIARDATARAGTDGWVVARWSLACPDAADLSIHSTLLQAVAPSHLHFARAVVGGAPARERVLTFADAAFPLAGSADLGGSLQRYVGLGVDHILSGWDHLAFVLALILLATGLREVALVVTGFTLAHSLTLAAAVLGWADVREDAVEALIGFSIALVAAENLWLRAGRERWLPILAAAALAALAALGATRLPPVLLVGLALFTACYLALARDAARPLRLRVAIAFVFGLVHGFGFATALAELRLPDERLAIGLLGFNAGVELGQLLVVAAVWPLLKLLERRPALRVWSGDLASAGVCALGTFWFVSRALG
jgi:hypothetical protein